MLFCINNGSVLEGVNCKTWHDFILMYKIILDVLWVFLFLLFSFIKEYMKAHKVSALSCIMCTIIQLQMRCACTVRNNNHKQYWYRTFRIAIISHCIIEIDVAILYYRHASRLLLCVSVCAKKSGGIGSLAFIFTLQIISWHSRPILCLWHFRLNNNCIISKNFTKIQ